MSTPRPTPSAPPTPAGLCNAGYNAVLTLLCQHDAEIAGLHATINDLTARLAAVQLRTMLPPPAAGPCSCQGGCTCPPRP